MVSRNNFYFNILLCLIFFLQQVYVTLVLKIILEDKNEINFLANIFITTDNYETKFKLGEILPARDTPLTFFCIFCQAFENAHILKKPNWKHSVHILLKMDFAILSEVLHKHNFGGLCKISYDRCCILY